MQREIYAEELAEFFLTIGNTLWQIQHLEFVMVSFLVVKVVYEERRAGKTISANEYKPLLLEKRKLTLGPLIESCHKKKIIKLQDKPRFEAFKLERHWLVHRALFENRNDLYLDDARNALFSRIEAIREEAAELGNMTLADMTIWMESHGVDSAAAQRKAEEDIRKLKGL